MLNYLYHIVSYCELCRLLAVVGEPGRPEIVRVEGTSMSLEWTAPDGIDERPITGYIIKYGVADSDAELYDTENVDQVTVAHTFTGKLQPHTSYKFAVAAKTGAGRGPFSQFSDCSQTNAGYCFPQSSTLDCRNGHQVARN